MGPPSLQSAAPMIPGETQITSGKLFHALRRRSSASRPRPPSSAARGSGMAAMALRTTSLPPVKLGLPPEFESGSIASGEAFDLNLQGAVLGVSAIHGLDAWAVARGEEAAGIDGEGTDGAGAAEGGSGLDGGKHAG